MADRTDRTVLVSPERMPGWVERFAARHGEVTVDRADGRVTVRAPDGAVASYDETPPPVTFGLLLLRRGGFAVGLVEGTALVASKCDRRYVQGRTKAGGWSQQRYARRRSNQAEALVRQCAEAAERVFEGRARLAVFGGGDRDLVREALEAIRIDLREADRWLDVREPRLQVLRDAVGQARSVRVRLNALA